MSPACASPCPNARELTPITSPKVPFVPSPYPECPMRLQVNFPEWQEKPRPACVRESVRGLGSRHIEQERQAGTAPGERQADTHMSTAQNARPSHPCPSHAGVLLGQRREQGAQAQPSSSWSLEIGSRGVWHPPGSQKKSGVSWPRLLLTLRVEFGELGVSTS